MTNAASVLLEQGRVAVGAATAAVERTRRAATQPRRLTVAVKPGAGTGLLKQIIERCAQDPRIPQVHLLFGHPGGPGAAVRDGAADVAILHAPFDQRALDTELLLTEPRVAAPAPRPQPRTPAPRSTTSASCWIPSGSAAPSPTSRSPSRTSTAPPTRPSCRSAT